MRLIKGSELKSKNGKKWIISSVKGDLFSIESYFSGIKTGRISGLTSKDLKKYFKDHGKN